MTGEAERSGHRILISGAQGVGKTTSIQEDLTASDPKRVTWFLSPTIEKSKEAAKRYAAIASTVSPTSRVVLGRSALDPEAQPDQQGVVPRMCLRHLLAEDVARAGLSIQDKLCELKARGQEPDRCPHFYACGYQRQLREIDAAPHGVFFAAHEYLFLPSPMPKPDYVIVDEDVTMKVAEIQYLSLSAFDSFGSSRNPARIADYRRTADAVRSVLINRSGQELEYLRSNGIDRSALEAAATYIDMPESRSEKLGFSCMDLAARGDGA